MLRGQIDPVDVAEARSRFGGAPDDSHVGDEGFPRVLVEGKPGP